jgi:hypothetical protein
MDCPDILDFEASGFGHDSYPVEVGYSLGCGERFCMLIKPEQSWVYWDEKAEGVHGISRELLQQSGQDVERVCQVLNQRLAGRTLYSDAWVVDKAWLNKLFAAARLQTSFQLSAIEHIQTECQYLMWDRVRHHMLDEACGERHRASSDAEFIQRVYARTQSLCLGKTSSDVGWVV